jgi:hypothetical protein
MGNIRDKNKCLGVIRGGAIDRVKAIEQQGHVRPQKKEAQKTYWQENVVLANA